jgi:GT2 family glycosyltransferase
MKNKWFIGIKKKSEDLFDTTDYVSIDSPIGTYYADPFVYKHNGVNYLFFEEYDYKKGVISYSIINDDLTITPPTKIIEEPFHLSFPNVFEDNGKIYMIPETGDSGKIILYEAEEFPNKWIPSKVIAENVRTSDIEIFNHNGKYILFTTSGIDLDHKLTIFSSDSLLGEWNVVGAQTITNSRPAGKIFEWGGKLIRPVQNNTKIYGGGLVFKSIEFDDNNNYIEKVIHEIQADWYPKLIGTHTFNFNEDYIVMDGKIRVEEIYIKGIGQIEITPTKITPIQSTHVDKPQRTYEVWDGCDVNGETKSFFVIKRHDPWIDENILSDNSLVSKLLDYTQTEKNKIVKTFKISSDIIVTEYHSDYYPLIIKSANNFYERDYAFELRDKFHEHFSNRETAVQFYNDVISKHIKISDELGISFEDVSPNNILIKNDFSDFKIIDIGSLRKIPFENIYSLTQIIWGDGANDLRLIDGEYLKSEWDKQVLEELPLTFCISTFNNLEYLKIAVDSVRRNSYFKDAPFIIHAENCTDGTNEWLKENSEKYNLEYYLDKNDNPKGIGGGMNFCADRVETEYIMFLHSDFYVTPNWDKALFDVFDKYPYKKMWVNSHRVEPKMFTNSESRQGTVVVPQDVFGAYYDDFNSDAFDEFAKEFTEMNNFEIPKGEGVSALIRKKDWDEIGGNDPLFAPASYDDMDLFLRMLQSGFEFILPTTSLIWHFGARGSHRLEENDGKTSERQLKAERDNLKKWISKWGSPPTFDEYGMINGIK